MQRFRADVIDNATANATAVYEDAIGMPHEVLLEDLVSQLDGRESLVPNAFQGPSVTAFAREDNRSVLTVPRHVNSEGERIADVDVNISHLRCVNIVRVEELHLADAREHAIDADADEVGVVAIGFNPFVDLGFVGERNNSAVYLTGVPG